MIPALDEESRLPACLEALVPVPPEVEVLVIDGGSRDRTREIAEATPGVRVAIAPRGRAIQMNQGAGLARGRILWFLHADARPPGEALGAIVPALEAAGVVAGAFRLSLDAPGLAYRAIELGVRVRSEVLGIPYGDQGLFLPRTTFEAVGGFPEIGALEDLYLVRELRRKGRIRVLPIPLSNSVRSWERRGIVGNTLRNWGLVIRDWVVPTRSPAG